MLVIDVVVVFVVVVDGETSLVGCTERDKVVVFVDVLLFVDVDVSSTFNGPKFRSTATATAPGPVPKKSPKSADNPNNLRLTILYIIYKLTLDLLVYWVSLVLIYLSRTVPSQLAKSISVHRPVSGWNIAALSIIMPFCLIRCTVSNNSTRISKRFISFAVVPELI